MTKGGWSREIVREPILTMTVGRCAYRLTLAHLFYAVRAATSNQLVHNRALHKRKVAFADIRCTFEDFASHSKT